MNTRCIYPTTITVGILALGVAAMALAASGSHVIAAQLILLAAILDGLDGEVARLTRGHSRLGANLDTYVDLVSFGVAPALLVYQSTWHVFGLQGWLIAFMIVLSGVIRFAHNHDHEEEQGRHTFRGLPIPISAGWMATIVLFNRSEVWANNSTTSPSIRRVTSGEPS